MDRLLLLLALSVKNIVRIHLLVVVFVPGSLLGQDLLQVAKLQSHILCRPETLTEAFCRAVEEETVPEVSPQGLVKAADTEDDAEGCVPDGVHELLEACHRVVADDDLPVLAAGELGVEPGGEGVSEMLMIADKEQ